jgi:hypothetical protein
LLGACIVDDESTTPPTPLEEQAVLELDVVERGPAVEADICGLAAALSRDNVCSLVCDPEGFQARLLHDGMSGGRCYQIRCELGADTVVSVGMCLP